MIIACDFDGTLCEHKYPKIGIPYAWEIYTLISLRSLGHKVILWTCRDNEPLKEAIEWCKGFGLEFDAVNDVPEIKNTFTNKSHKVYADYYLDDRNRSISEIRSLEDC